MELRTRQERHNGIRLSITTSRQCPNIVNINSIIQEAHERASVVKNLSDMDRLRETVGIFIQIEIKSMEHHKEEYRASADMCSVDANDAYFPRSLQLLLGSIIKRKNAKLYVFTVI